MNTALLFTIVVVIVVAVVGVVAWVSRPVRGPSRNEKDQAILIRKLQALAYEFKDTDTNLSFKITDAINEHNAKELT